MSFRGRVGNENVRVLVCLEPALRFVLGVIHTPTPERSKRDGTAESEDGDTIDLDCSSMEDMKMLVGLGSATEFELGFGVAVHKDARYFDRTYCIDDGLKSLAHRCKVTRANDKIGSLCIGSDILDRAEVSVDITDCKDIHI